MVVVRPTASPTTLGWITDWMIRFSTQYSTMTSIILLGPPTTSPNSAGGISPVMNASSAHNPAAGMPRITRPMPSNTATMPPKTVATPKYRRVPWANLPRAPRTGSWPARTRFIRSPNTDPSRPRKITSTSTKNSDVSVPVTELSRLSMAEMIELELTLSVIDWMSDWLIPKPASQVSRLVMSCWISEEYCGSRVASWATPMTSPTTSPIRMAKTTITRVRLASQRGAPFRIINPRIGSTVTVSTRAKKTGPRMAGTWWIPAATITAAAKPRMMIRPRGCPYIPYLEFGGGGSVLSADTGSAAVAARSLADSAEWLSVIHLSVLGVAAVCRRGGCLTVRIFLPVGRPGPERQRTTAPPIRRRELRNWAAGRCQRL